MTSKGDPPLICAPKAEPEPNYGAQSEHMRPLKRAVRTCSWTSLSRGVRLIIMRQCFLAKSAVVHTASQSARVVGSNRPKVKNEMPTNNCKIIKIIWFGIAICSRKIVNPRTILFFESKVIQLRTTYYQHFTFEITTIFFCISILHLLHNPRAWLLAHQGCLFGDMSKDSPKSMQTIVLQ
jgi:hypothetical protein